MKKTVIGLICGGRGAEHEVDLFSVPEVRAFFDASRFEVVILAIGKDGTWYFSKTEEEGLLNIGQLDKIAVNTSRPVLHLRPGGDIIERSSNERLAHVDVFFPITDDPVQDMLDQAGVPYMGSGLDASLKCRDKEATKKLIQSAGYHVAEHIAVKDGDDISFAETVDRLGLPLFIKPNGLGSSIGITKAVDEKTFFDGLKNAFAYDANVLIEQAIAGREIECAVLGNEKPVASSVLGEITELCGFFDFRTKYIDSDCGKIVIPAAVSPSVVAGIREASVDVFERLGCRGYARVDFFLLPDDSFIIIEVNSSPGLAKHLMYPKLWEASGVSYAQLLDRLIELARLQVEL